MYFYGISSDSVSSFFNQNYGSAVRNNQSFGFGSLYSSLGDYSTIRSGTYTKLLKSYYTKTDSTDKKGQNSSNVISEDKKTATDASALKSTSNTLSSSKFTEDGRKELTKNINLFVSSYNDLMSSAKGSKNHSVKQKYQSLTNLTDHYSSLLSSVGIQVNSDHSLSIDKDKLEKADLSTLKSTFSGSYSYTSQVSNYASLIYSANLNGVESIYTNSGTISTMSQSSILDAFA